MKMLTKDACSMHDKSQTFNQNSLEVNVVQATNPGLMTGWPATNTSGNSPFGILG